MANGSVLMKINDLSPEEVIKITLKGSDGSHTRVVKAPLPDGFGLSVGSSFTDPHNIDLASHGGSSRIGQFATGAASMAARATGMSTKIAMRSNTFYAGPEPTEISFDMEFHAYYSAYHEVVIPAANLMMMSVGREIPFEELNETVAQALRAYSEATNGGDDGSGFGFLRSAGVCEVRFGKTFKIPRAYVSSVGAKFSNVLDNQGFPISAVCSVTIKVVRNPTQFEVGSQYFGGIV